jgi:ketosteroid isomerase-like protein
MHPEETERTRRRDLLRAHLEAENAGDIAGVMATFAADAVMRYNGLSFPEPDAIRGAHTYLGFSRGTGAFANARNIVDRKSFTDTDIVVEGRMRGTHQGEFLGFVPSGREVELPFVAFYEFGPDGKLVSERVVMDLGRLLSPRPPSGK